MKKKVIVGIIPRLNSSGNPEFLLMSSKRNFGKYTGFYYPPGGHLEKNEKEEAALVREIKEELGFEVIPLKKICESKGDIKDQTTYWWICSSIVDGLKLQEDEVVDAKWFTKEEILKSYQVWPATKKFFKDFKIGKTVSAGGLIIKNSKILFVTFPNRDLVFPKGHVEKGETIENAAIREVKEETGLKNIEIVKKLGMYNRPASEGDGSIVLKDIHIFLMKADDYNQNDAEEKTGWFTIDKAIPHLFQQEAKFLMEIKNELI